MKKCPYIDTNPPSVTMLEIVAEPTPFKCVPVTEGEDRKIIGYISELELQKIKRAFPEAEE